MQSQKPRTLRMRQIKLPKGQTPYLILSNGDKKLPLSTQQLTKAWRWLECSPNPNPPRGLRHLTREQWHAVAQVLWETLQEQEESQLH